MADKQVRKAGPVPTEVLDYWDGKGLRPAFSYLDVWNEEHDWGFTAAKVMRTDVLGELQRQLRDAIALGKDFGQFKTELEPAMRALGWWDKHVVKDPITGELADVDPPHRLRTIFDTNMRTARAVGQLERAVRNKDTRPYLLYTVGPSHRHREQHLAWHGTMLPIDDPFWNYAYPPNGWGCKCCVQTVSESMAKRLDGDGILAPEPEPVLDDEGNPTGHVMDRRVPISRVSPTLNFKPFENPRTGKVELVPEGIDPGFHHRPGEGRALALKR